MKIAYLIDSSSSFKDDDNLLFEEDVFFLPLHVIVDNENFAEDRTLDRDVVFEKLLTAENVTTSQPTFGDIEAVLNEIVEKGYDCVVSMCIASGLSGTQASIFASASDKDIEYIAIDSKCIGPVVSPVVWKFKEMIADGHSIEECVEMANDYFAGSAGYAVVDNLMYLSKGGRLKASSAIMGTLLKYKPIAMCDRAQDGAIINIDKVRTRKKAYERMMDIAIESMDEENYELVVGSFDSAEAAVVLQDMIFQKLGYKPEIVDISFMIGAHTGPNTLCLFTVHK